MIDRRFWALACVVAVSGLVGSAARGEEKVGAPVTLRVLSYNIHHAEGADRKVDLERIAKIIRAAGPDLVAVQEVDVKTRRVGGVDQAAELGRLTGMHVYFAKAMDYQGGEYGQVVLSRHAIVAGRTHRLPGDEKAEPRTVAEVSAKIGGRDVVLMGTHLDHRDEAARVRQAEEINRLAGRVAAGAVVLLAGDLNARPESAPMKEIGKVWTDATAGEGMETIPAERPRSKIDYVMWRAGAEVKVVEKRVIGEGVASDHRPVLAVVEVGGK